MDCARTMHNGPQLRCKRTITMDCARCTTDLNRGARGPLLWTAHDAQRTTIEVQEDHYYGLGTMHNGPQSRCKRTFTMDCARCTTDLNRRQEDLFYGLRTMHNGPQSRYKRTFTMDCARCTTDLNSDARGLCLLQ